MTTRTALVACTILLASVSTMLAQSAVPDFSGVYRPVNAFGPPPGGAPPGQRAGGPSAPGQPLSPPARTAPLSDGSRGRAPTAPKLTPEYMAKWQAISKARVAGSSDSDNTLKCLPPGMPAMMNMAYGMEVMQTRDKITFFSELNDALRRVYLDGRTPSQVVLDDPTYAGYSTGHWEGDTLVVETTNFTSKTQFRGSGENLKVTERFTRTDPKTIVYRFTVEDPSTWERPWTGEYNWTTTDDQIYEYACHEGNYALENMLRGARSSEKTQQ